METLLCISYFRNFLTSEAIAEEGGLALFCISGICFYFGNFSR